jgi:hypothetical protein
MYDYYEASPEAVRLEAFHARSSSAALYHVSDNVSGRHRDALAATDGDLTLAMTGADRQVVDYTSKVNRSAIWAALQVENFADAIETYNTGSTDPMSISRLNAKVQSVNEMGISVVLCLAGPQPTGAGDTVTQAEKLQWTQQQEGAYQAQLDAHYRRLGEQLDRAAEKISTALRDGPSDAAIIAAWKAGNLPGYAALAWPELNLNRIPIDGVDPSLLNISGDDIAGLLGNRDNPLSEAELEWLRLNFPVDMANFANNWTLDGKTIPAGESPAGMEDVHAPYGWILGPDGRWYPVGVPTPNAPSDQPAFTATGSSTFPNDPGWLTLGHRQGPLYVGNEPIRWLNIVSGLAGGNPQIYGPQSIGENQSDYLSYDSNGAVYTHGQLADRNPAWGLPKGLPPGSPPTVPPGTYNPVEAMESSDRYIRTQAASSALSLTIGGLRGAVLNEQIDANNSYHGNITFQQGADGQYRAIVQTSQIEYDRDSGEVNSTPQMGNAVLDEDGNFQPYYHQPR